MNIHGDKISPYEINDHESIVNSSSSAANFDLDSSDVEDSSNDNSIVLSLDIISPQISLSSSSSIPPSSNKGSYFDPIINENQSDQDYIANNRDDVITTKGTIIHTVGFVSYNSNRTDADDHHESNVNIGIDDSDFDSVVYHSGYEEDTGNKSNNDDVISKVDDNNSNSRSSSSNSSRGSQVDEMIVVSSPSLSKQTTRDETDVSNKLTTISSDTKQHNTVNNIIDRITTLMLDASELRNSIVDLDDKQASTLRSVRLYIGWMKFYMMKLIIMMMMMMMMMMMVVVMMMMMMMMMGTKYSNHYYYHYCYCNYFYDT
jgi:hypothetical protein